MRALERELFQRSLRDAIPYMWPVLEPARPYISGWPIDAICDHLEAVTRGQITRLIMNVPPGSMKSLSTRVFWPSWEWAQEAERDKDGEIIRPCLGMGAATRYIGASYAEHLAVRDNRRSRSVVTSRNYQAMFPHVKLSDDQKAKVNFANTRTGWMFATSTTGLGTGERGDRFIIDDPHNISNVESSDVREKTLQWFAEVVPSRLNDMDRSAIIVIMQRTHADDVTGYAMEKELGYEHLMIPMHFDPARIYSFAAKKAGMSDEAIERATEELSSEEMLEFYAEHNPSSIGWSDPRTADGELMWEDRFSEEAVDRLERTLGPYAAASQLEQTPVPREGGMFETSRIKKVNEIPPGEYVWVRAWDLAASEGKGAWTSGVLIGINKRTNRVIIADVKRDRLSGAGVRKLIKDTAEDDGKSIPVMIPKDPGQAGKAQVESMIAEMQGFTIKAEPQTGSKETRAEPLSAQVENGSVDVLDAFWTATLLSEYKFFPRGKYKDQVDASASAYNEAAKRFRKGSKDWTPPITERSDVAEIV